MLTCFAEPVVCALPCGQGRCVAERAIDEACAACGGARGATVGYARPRQVEQVVRGLAGACVGERCAAWRELVARASACALEEQMNGSMPEGCHALALLERLQQFRRAA